MNRTCTSIEQSKKLIEVGIDINTADILYSPPIITHYDESDGYCRELPSYKVINTRCNIIEDNKFDEPLPIRKDDIPAWSLNALLKIITVLNFTIKCENNKFNIDIPERHCKIWFPSLIDAAFEMVYWYLKNKNLQII